MIFLTRLLSRQRKSKEGQMRKDGYITIYLSLTIAAVLFFAITLTEGIRVQTIKFQTECVMDIGLSSIFAEYNRELLNQYGLLAIDASYGESGGNPERTKGHLLQYMNMNFTAPGQTEVLQFRDLTAIHADNANLSDVSYLSDGEGMVLKYQIVKLMKEKTGISYVEDAVSIISGEQNERKYKQLESEKESCFGQIDDLLNEINEVRRQEEKDEISIENPAEQVERMNHSLLLDLAIKDCSSIMRREVDLSEYISHRGYKEGAGLWKDQEESDGGLNNILFRRYIMEQCGCFRSEKENSRLGYQLEYLLYGKDNDFDNLDAFAGQVFRERYVINAAYLFSNSAKVNQAASLAMTVTTGIGSPQLSEAVKYTILFSWCYAETVQDLRIIFDGNGAAWVKDDSSWNVPLSELLTFTSALDSYHAVDSGKTYYDYLSEFLLFKNEKILRMRLMDIMEMDIRMTEGNRYFRMDNSIYQLKAEVNVTSQYGYGFTIERDYSYE